MKLQIPYNNQIRKCAILFISIAQSGLLYVLHARQRNLFK